MQCSTVEEYLHDKPLKLNSVTEKRHEDHIPLTSLLYSSYILFHWKQKRKGEKMEKMIFSLTLDASLPQPDPILILNFLLRSLC